MAADRNPDSSSALNESDVSEDPIEQFGRWFEGALKAGLTEPTAITLATVGEDGTPSARVVLLKGYERSGFTFYTNYESEKARDLAANPKAALVCYWAELKRQIRIVGTVGRVSRAESEAYFRTRPVGSQIGAWASSQSAVLSSRGELERRAGELARQYAGKEIPCPPHWGGYRVTPETIEFWQGRSDRLHDRLRYTLVPSGTWQLSRLAP